MVVTEAQETFRLMPWRAGDGNSLSKREILNGIISPLAKHPVLCIGGLLTVVAAIIKIRDVKKQKELKNELLDENNGQSFEQRLTSVIEKGYVFENLKLEVDEEKKTIPIFDYFLKKKNVDMLNFLLFRLDAQKKQIVLNGMLERVENIEDAKMLIRLGADPTACNDLYVIRSDPSGKSRYFPRGQEYDLVCYLTSQGATFPSLFHSLFFDSNTSTEDLFKLFNLSRDDYRNQATLSDLEKLFVEKKLFLKDLAHWSLFEYSKMFDFATYIFGKERVFSTYMVPSHNRNIKVEKDKSFLCDAILAVPLFYSGSILRNNQWVDARIFILPEGWEKEEDSKKIIFRLRDEEQFVFTKEPEWGESYYSFTFKNFQHWPAIMYPESSQKSLVSSEKPWHTLRNITILTGTVSLIGIYQAATMIQHVLAFTVIVIGNIALEIFKRKQEADQRKQEANQIAIWHNFYRSFADKPDESQIIERLATSLSQGLDPLRKEFRIPSFPISQSEKITIKVSLLSFFLYHKMYTVVAFLSRQIKPDDLQNELLSAAHYIRSFQDLRAFVAAEQQISVNELGDGQILESENILKYVTGWIRNIAALNEEQLRLESNNVRQEFAVPKEEEDKYYAGFEKEKGKRFTELSQQKQQYITESDKQERLLWQKGYQERRHELQRKENEALAKVKEQFKRQLQAQINSEIVPMINKLRDSQDNNNTRKDFTSLFSALWRCDKEFALNLFELKQEAFHACNTFNEIHELFYAQGIDLHKIKELEGVSTSNAETYDAIMKYLFTDRYLHFQGFSDNSASYFKEMKKLNIDGVYFPQSVTWNSLNYILLPKGHKVLHEEGKSLYQIMCNEECVASFTYQLSKRKWEFRKGSAHPSIKIA